MKEKIMDAIKFCLLTYMMTNGFFLMYAFVWQMFGLNLTDLTMFILYGVAILSEFGYVKWVSR